MDIDISDILASVSRPLHPPPSHSSTTTLDSTTTLSDHHLLIRTWTAERTSPSLLPYPTPLITRTLHRIQSQITRIEDLTAGISLPDSPNHPGQNTNLILSILQTDLGRTQFLLRSYLRQRLAKVTKHAVFYARQHQMSAGNGSGHESKDPLLSPAELAFLERHQALLTRFYDGSFLSAFPANLRRLDDRAGGVDMVEGPDGGGAVVVRCLAEVWGNAAELGVGAGEEGSTTELRMGRGEVWVVRWRDVRSGVVGGEVELL